MRIPTYFLLSVWVSWSTLQAQRATIEDFTLVGDTYLTEQDCFRLTEAEIYASGSIWYKHPIDLSQPFSIQLSVMLGCEDAAGADGMVFVFAPQTNKLGFVGEGIGFAGLAPSIGIEIDTWLNYHLNDPAEDHIAIMANGRVGHRSDLAGPTPIPNLEDCVLHSLVIIWRPDLQRLSVEIDQEEVIAAQYDLIGGIFRGNPQVYWGVTAATGRYYNVHEVCFDRIGYLPDEVESEEEATWRWGKE